MAGNIIPAIATTNAMTAGLCVLQAFKVLRQDYSKARMLFLAKSADRLISSESLRPPKPDCPICGVARARIEVDLSRATLENLVEDLLRGKLGYGEEFAVSSDAGILFDPDLDDNLPKKLRELNIEADAFLTVMDEADEDPHVNLVLSVSGKDLPRDASPVLLPGEVEIPRRPKPAPAPPSEVVETNGHNMSNGIASDKRKRTADEAELEADVVKKRGKVMEENHSSHNDMGEAIDVEMKDSNGAILIDD